MKKKFNKFFIGALCLATLGGLSLGCAKRNEVPKEDFIKIHDVKYNPVDVSERQPEIIYLGDMPTFNIEYEGYDKDGVGEIRYYLDGECFAHTLQIDVYDRKGNLTGADKHKRLEKWFHEIPLNYSPLEENPNLEKGEHTLKVVLKDCQGNTVEDAYTFEVK